jgi:putative addiction module CopG family antidote
MNLSLPAELDNFVQNLVLSGSYADPSEGVSNALQMLKHHEELRSGIQKGIDQLNRGEATEYDEHSLHRFNSDIKIVEELIFGRESGKS